MNNAGEDQQDGYRTFEITLMAVPGSDSIKAIRALLKIALRRFEMRCIDVREVVEERRRVPR